MRLGLTITADQELVRPMDCVPKGYVLVKRWANMDASLYAPWPVGIPWRWCHLARQWFLWRWFKATAWEKELVLAAHEGRRQAQDEYRQRFDRDITAAREEGYKTGYTSGWNASLDRLVDSVKRDKAT